MTELPVFLLPIILKTESLTGNVCSSCCERRGLFILVILQTNFKVVDGNLNQVVWTFSGAKGWYQAKAVIDDELVIVPCNDRNIYALNTENGELVWNYQGDFAFIAEPVIVDDKVIVSAQDHHVLVLNRDTGEELYRVAANGAVVSTPLYDETTGAVYFGSFGKELISFDLETGDINWVFGENRDLATIWGELQFYLVKN